MTMAFATANKDLDLKKKRAEVSAWFAEVLKHEPAPDFEMNARTIQILHRLSVISQCNEKNTQFYIDDLKKKSEEYNADARRLGNILDKLQLGQNSLSDPGSSCVQALARTGAALSVKDASDTCYMLSMRELNSSLNELAENLHSENTDLQRLSRKTQDALMKRNALEKALEVLDKRSTQEAAHIAERKKETAIVKKATAENDLIIEKLKVKLSQSGLSESDFHDKLVKKKEKLDALENELAPLRDELQSFSSLPPDAIEAKVKVEQLKRELSQLQKQMTECVDVALLQ